jgi:hypothetical protein
LVTSVIKEVLAMDTQRQAHGTNFVIRALLAALCVLVIPKLAQSEPGVSAPQQYVSGEGSKRDPLVGGGTPVQLSSRLFPDSDDCVLAKVDIWLERGRVIHSLFLPGQRAEHHAEIRPGGAEGTTMIIGGKNCLIRVRIERAANPSSDN